MSKAVLNIGSLLLKSGSAFLLPGKPLATVLRFALTCWLIRYCTSLNASALCLVELETPMPHDAYGMPRLPVKPSSAGRAATVKFSFGLFFLIRLMCASESITMPTWPLVNFSTLSCSFMVSEPVAMTPASFRLFTYSTVLLTGGLVRLGLPSCSMLPPEAQSHDMTSFWMPLGTAVSRGSAQPLTSPPVALIFLAASMNWVRVLGTALTPALASRSLLTNSG